MVEISSILKPYSIQLIHLQLLKSTSKNPTFLMTGAHHISRNIDDCFSFFSSFSTLRHVFLPSTAFSRHKTRSKLQCLFRIKYAACLMCSGQIITGASIDSFAASCISQTVGVKFPKAAYRRVYCIEPHNLLRHVFIVASTCMQYQPNRCSPLTDRHLQRLTD